MRLTKADIERVYDEFDRRLGMDMREAYYDGHIDIDIDGTRRDRLQGVYGTLMVLVPQDNWSEIVFWIDEIERERYGGR